MTKRLYKSDNKMICGVCAGIAEYFNIDPTLVRLITVFLLFAGVGSGLIAYIVAAVIIPEKSAGATKSATDIPEKEAER